MSIDAIGYAKTLDVNNPTSRLLLFIIAENTFNDSGLCRVGQKVLSYETRTSDKTIRAHLRKLQQANVIEIKARPKPLGGRALDDIRLVGFLEWLSKVRATGAPNSPNRKKLPVRNISQQVDLSSPNRKLCSGSNRKDPVQENSVPKERGTPARLAPADLLSEQCYTPEVRARPRRKAGQAQGGELESAVEIYNQAAEQRGFSRCASLTEARRRRLIKRLDDIGGVENFHRALSVIAKDDWLMGRKKPKPGESRFKLGIDYLMRTDERSGDVLAKLVDKADEVELAECERFNIAWLIAFGNHMMGDPLDPPQWMADFPAPWATTGQPFTVEQARAWVRETPLWAQVLDRYASGTGREDEFGCIRLEMFEKGEREQLIARRQDALQKPLTREVAGSVRETAVIETATMTGDTTIVFGGPGALR